MNAKLTIQERLKDLRVNDRGLTLEQLAEATGLARSTLGNYETNDYKDISPFNIAILARFYGVSTCWDWQNKKITRMQRSLTCI